MNHLYSSMLVTESKPSYQLAYAHFIFSVFFLPRSGRHVEGALKLFNLLTANEQIGNSRKLPQTSQVYVALCVCSWRQQPWFGEVNEQKMFTNTEKMKKICFKIGCALFVQLFSFPVMSFRPGKLSMEIWIDSFFFCAWMKIKLKLSNIFLKSFCINSTKSFDANAEHNVKTLIRLSDCLKRRVSFSYYVGVLCFGSY